MRLEAVSILVAVFPRAGARATSAMVPLVLLFLPLNVVHAASSPFADAMKTAADARAVPVEVVEATAFVNTEWEWITTRSNSGGVGPMDVRDDQMTLATSLSGHTEAQIKSDLAANLDAGAALIAHYHTTGSGLDSWHDSLASVYGPRVADEIFSVLQSGVSRTTNTGETITLAPQVISSPARGAQSVDGTASASVVASPDYSPATWVPASSANFTVADRTHDYPIDMIVIHDIEGSASSAIQAFQNPDRQASAHYVISSTGAVTQMVLEKDIAWHAGNWDYNTRAIGIEHAGFAYTPNTYTNAEYKASAQLAASICSRYGLPMDRTHVIGHYQVPDPNNPGLFGGDSHHTDPGPYWNWTYYMNIARAYAAALPSPPHLVPDPVAVNTATGATVTWKPARTCHEPITGYTVTGTPDNLSMTLPASATSATFNNLRTGTRYTFTVTAINADGQDNQDSNTIIPGACRGASLTSDLASPQLIGATVHFTFGSTTCANPNYQLWMLPPGGTWTVVQAYSPSTSYTWRTSGLAYGIYGFGVWARDASSPGVSASGGGTFDDREGIDYRLVTPPCTSTNVVVTPPGGAMGGVSTVTLSASAAGCANPRYEFWVKPPGGVWGIAQAYSTTATWSFATSSRVLGSYYFSVWVRDAGSLGPNGTYPNTYDAFHAFAYTVSSGCPSATASVAPPTTATIGTTLTVTAGAPGCANPRYEFWLKPPGQSWRIVRGYATGNTWTWNTTGNPPGTYFFSIWVRAASSSASFDAYQAITYSLTSVPCTGMSASPTPSTAARGTSVSIKGIAAGCPSPRYEFWVLPPGGKWTLLKAYSSSDTYVWSTTGKAVGKYAFSVWARDASSAGTHGSSPNTYDSFSSFQFTLT